MLSAAMLASLAAGATAADPRGYANERDMQRAAELAERAADWRNGAVVYQVIVDRFAPPADLDAKRGLYPAPKILRNWDEVPKQGTYVEEAQVWSHEIEFWGGDLDSLKTRLDYVEQLGVDVLYLNPIHQAYTNHKYDAQDYFAVSPEYGTREDVKELAEEVHKRQMRLVLDGVFNHMGRTAPAFQSALNDPDSEWRDWFYIGAEYKLGYRAWVNVANLPEINLENPQVRARIYGDPDSVIQGYLRDGVDGWRLDVAFDIGFRWLRELTVAAHTAKPGSLVIGEIWNYPEEWSPSVDGVMNMTAREIILQTARGNIPAEKAGRFFERMVQDCGLDPLLKAWIILDNHDTPRLRTSLQERWQQKVAQVLQFTVPGSPCIYYGVELGMEGGDDPAMRAPMRWDLVEEENEYLQWMRQLMKLRKESPALRYGDFRLLDSDSVLAFLRTTDKVEDLRLVVVNPSDEAAEEVLLVRDSKLMSYGQLRDALSGQSVHVMAGTLTIKAPPRSAAVYVPVLGRDREYTPYKRVK